MAAGKAEGRATVEGGLTLDLYTILRRPGGRGVQPLRAWSGELTWNRHGEPFASIGCTVRLSERAGSVRLRYAIGGKPSLDYSIDLATTPQPFGGRRWWFECPRSGDYVAKLYLPAGATRFGSRASYRLAYECQRETTYSRSVSRVWKQRHALGSSDPIGTDIPSESGDITGRMSETWPI